MKVTVKRTRHYFGPYTREDEIEFNTSEEGRAYIDQMDSATTEYLCDGYEQRRPDCELVN